MKTTFHKNLKAFTLCAGFFSLVACKEKSSINPDLIPDVDNINTFEVNNLTMSVKNSYYDSLQTNVSTYPLVGVGGISNDAFFGKTTAGAYMQFIPPDINFTFPANSTFDSAVISMPYVSFSYADTVSSNSSHVLKLKAYEITDNFALGDGSTSYFSFNRLAYNTTAVGSGTISMASLVDTALILSSGDTVKRLLRMRVDGIIPKFKNLSDNNLISSAEVFLNNFQGIYLGPDTTQTQNTIAYFALGGIGTTANYDRAQLELYYHVPSDTKLYKTFFKFNTAYCSFFNGIYRNYNGVKALDYFLNQTVDRDSLLMQGYPGFRSDLTVKLDKIPPSVINKAQIIITALKTGDDARFNAPKQLIVTTVSDDGTEKFVADLLNNDGTTNSSGQAFVDGAAKTVSIGGVDYIQYTLNIPREFQRAVSAGQTELKLRLASSVIYPGANRMVADGPNSTNANTRLKLNIIYTKLK